MATTQSLIYPWRFRRTIVPKPWAGERLGELFPALSKDLKPHTGETVEVAGYAAASTPILDGPAAGMTVAEVIATVGWETVLGVPGVDLPVVLKFLDTSQPLSVQVHPGDGWIGLGSRGKNECWLVLDAQADACVWQGKRAGLSEREFWSLLERGAVDEAMQRRPLVKGDFVDNPAGMVHAIGAGVVLAELQSACPVTWRIWDWGGRTEPGWEDTAESHAPRPLHLTEAKRAAKLGMGLAPVVRVDGGLLGEQVLRTGRDFSWVSVRWQGRSQRRQGKPLARLMTCLAGTIALETSGSGLQLVPGESAMLPAGLGEVELVSEDGWVVEATVG